MNSGLNALDSPPSTVASVTALLYDWRIWGVIALLALVLIGVGMYLNYERWATSPWWSDRYNASHHIFSWLSSTPDLKAIVPETEHQEYHEEPKHTPHNSPRDTRETWCLVGEDLNGRYCIRVPGPQSCTHDRSFLSQDQCELTPAMHLPAGAVKDNGIHLDPLRNHKFE